MNSRQHFEFSSYPAKEFPRERPRRGEPSAGNKDTTPERAPHRTSRLPAEGSAKLARALPEIPEIEHPTKDASPERALQRASRRISPQGLPSNFNVLYQFQSPRMSYTTKDFKSRRINTYKKSGHFSHLIENTQLQVLCNQHLRVFASQVLWIQHLHKNRGWGVAPRNPFIV